MDDDTWYLEYFGITTDESLAHYGVKGMKWGQRKERIAAGVRKYGSKAKEAAKARLKEMGAQTLANAKASLAERKKNRKMEKRNKKLDEQINRMDRDPNYVKRMSDEELQTAIKRKELEKKYNELSETPMMNFKKKVKKAASDAAADAVGNALRTLGGKAFSVVLDKAVEKKKAKAEKAKEEVRKREMADAEQEVADIIDMMGGWKPENPGEITAKDIASFNAMAKGAKEFNSIYSKTTSGKKVNKDYAEKKKSETPEGKREAKRKAEKEAEDRAKLSRSQDMSPYAHPESWMKQKTPEGKEFGDMTLADFSRSGAEMDSKIDKRVMSSGKRKKRRKA